MRVRGWFATAAAITLLLAPATVLGQEGGPRRGWLGFTYAAGGGSDAEAVIIESVYPGSPAAGAGVRAGDRIVLWNGNPEVTQVLESLRLEPGDTVRLRIRRGEDRDRDVVVVAGSRPTDVIARMERRRPLEIPQEELRALQEELRGVQEEVARLWERNGRALSAEERQRSVRELREKQEELARLFRENARVRELQSDSLVRFWRERLNVDSLAVHADSLQEELRLRLRTHLGPQLRQLGDELMLVMPEGTSRTVITIGHRAVAGAEFEAMNEGLASYFGTDEGVLVLTVPEATPAARSGLTPGDVVLEANDRSISTVGELRAAVARAEEADERVVRLEVLRQGQRREVQLRWE